VSAIEVRKVDDGDPLAFDVILRDENSETKHRVTLSRKDFERLRNGADAARLIEAAFRFLLDREPKESILTRFDVSVIARYFPDFEATLPNYFA
jgi:hypothetical protein